MFNRKFLCRPLFYHRSLGLLFISTAKALSQTMKHKNAASFGFGPSRQQLRLRAPKVVAQWSMKWAEYHESQVQIPVQIKILGDFFPYVLNLVIELPSTCCLVGGDKSETTEQVRVSTIPTKNEKPCREKNISSIFEASSH